jgi:hypothetical protein
MHNVKDETQAMPSLLSEVGTFAWEFISHWQSYVTGGVVTGGIGLIERLLEKRLSKRAYFGIFDVTFSLAAFFMIWREQFERAERLQLALNQKPQQPIIQVNVPPAQVIIQGPAQEEKKEEARSANNKHRVAPVKPQGRVAPPARAIGPSQPQPSESKPEPPKPMVASVKVASQQTIVSTDADFPYALEAVLQTDNVIEPVAFAIVCSGPIGKGNAGFSGGGVYIQTKSGQIADHPEMFGFEWKSPAFTPAGPIVVSVWSKEYVQVTGIQQIRYVWP